MALPNVIIEVQNGQLGSVGDTNDKVAGIVVSGVTIADPSWPAGTAKQFTSLEQVEAAGLDESYDTANSTNAWQQVKDFYQEAPEGTPLWILIAPPTETMTEICDSVIGNKYLTVLLDAAAGAIKIAGVTRKPDGAYVPTYVNGLDDDVITAMEKAQATQEAYQAAIKPVRILIEGRDYQGTAATLPDLKTRDDNGAAVVICGTNSADASASVGLVLGRAAANSVQRKISRVKSGNLDITAAYLSDGTSVEDAMDSGDIAAIHDKGYIVIRTFPQKSGYFFASDHMATADTDDFKTLANGRVIDKGVIITYQTYVEELGDEIDIRPDGTMNPSQVKSLEGAIENAIDQQMTAEGEISGVDAYIDPTQNILSTSNLEVVVDITPVGYSDSITVKLGFANPQAA